MPGGLLTENIKVQEKKKTRLFSYFPHQNLMIYLPHLIFYTLIEHVNKLNTQILLSNHFK